MATREKKAGTSRKRDTKGGRTVKRATKKGGGRRSGLSVDDTLQAMGDREWMEPGLPFGVHKSDTFLGPPNEPDPEYDKPKAKLADIYWSKGQIMLADLALAQNFRLSFRCGRHEAVSQTAGLARALKEPFGAGYNARYGVLFLWSTRDHEECDDEDETPTTD